MKHFALTLLFLFSTVSHAKSWWKLNPEDAYNAWDDTYWVSFEKNPAHQWMLEVYWSGATFVYDASTGCYEGIVSSYCFDKEGYNLLQDGSVIESGVYFR